MDLSSYDLKKMEDCVHFMVDSDGPAAEYRIRANALERKLKIVEASQFLKFDGGAESRKMSARATGEYLMATKELDEAEAMAETLRNMRETAKLQAALYQTKSANQRQKTC